MPVGGNDGMPGSAVVVGAGAVGLSTAWFLQEHGVEVTVLDRRGVAAGSSWGNAGYLAPSLSVPLPEPSVLRYGLRSLLDRDAPLYVPTTLDPGLWRFLAAFARRCTMRSWRRSMDAFVAMNTECLEAFDVLTGSGVRAPTHEAVVTAAFEDRAKVADLRREFDHVRQAGQPVEVSEIGPEEAGVPQLSSRVATVLRIEGQRYVDPGEFVRALARSVEERGGRIRTGVTVTDVRRESGGAAVIAESGERVAGDVVVLATGAWISGIARPLGVRTPVRAGRGYSFTVPTDEPVPGPIYLPAQKVACVPYRGGLRVAGTMEFRSADAPLDARRIDAIERSVRPLLTGVSWERRRDEWVGPRPVTPDGLPLIGEAATPGVFIAGGHGMWGLTMGPLTGRLLAERISTGKQPAELRPFDPLR